MADADHYADSYWNDLPAVLRYLKRRATGDPTLWWMDHLKEQWCTPPRRRGLVIGCGNGWVERDLVDRAVCEHFDAFDASDAYLDQARAERGDRPIRYVRGDFESFVPTGPYDLVVNVAALHHARFLYRHVARLAQAMEPDGIFVNWDYIGPKRNRYPVSQVAAMERVRDSLPPRFRTPHPLRIPLIQAINGDPTEAVHSNEILRAVEDHFDIVQRRDLGGGIAYQLLWNNVAPFEDPDDPEAESVLKRILAADEELTGTRAIPDMFSFFIARPKAARTLAARARLHLFEPVREMTPRMLRRRYPVEAALEAAARVRQRLLSRPSAAS